MDKSEQIHRQIVFLPRSVKRLVMLLADLIMVPVALWSAFALRFGDLAPPIAHPWLFLVAPAVCIPIFIRLGLYRAVVRYMGAEVMATVVKGVALSVFILTAIAYMAPATGTPRSIFIIFGLISVLYVAGSRYFVRGYFRWLAERFFTREAVAIYGAGGAGVQLATALNNSKEFSVAAYIDDNAHLRGSNIQGVRIYGSKDVQSLIDNKHITEILLAVPSASKKERKAILERLEPYPIHVRTIPSLPNLISGQASFSDIQEVEVEDVLGRDTVPAKNELLGACIEGKSVLVTGAGGSIGSELCRQIIKLAPKHLVLFEVSEIALYTIEKELARFVSDEGVSVSLHSVLGCVQNKKRISHVMKELSVQTVYHAAAYKHVPIVEANPSEGIKNNVLGTLAVAEAAVKNSVETFILVSTDKSVRPTNVMGASKRMAELVLQSKAMEYPEGPCFCMVRFGNVLGSSGSVVPLFREQIKKGGPVTVTHPEVTRYFMTIPEAAELVIQAGALAKGGDVFLLDMGEPVKIVDLAEKLIRLTGNWVKSDENEDGIEITFTGLRPGEKLYEELLIGDSSVGTNHPMIMSAQEESLSVNEMKEHIRVLAQACEEDDKHKIFQVLLLAVSGYKPDNTHFAPSLVSDKGIPDNVSSLPLN